MENKTKQSFLHGAVILTAATVIVKVVGALFKIPLGNIIGNVGMGYFNTAYALFNVVYSLAIAGLPIAVAKLVSEYEALGRHRDTRRVLRISRGLFLLTGVIGSVVMLAGARVYANAVNNSNAVFAVIALAPTIFFACVMSIYRGYYEGLKNMYPTAVSQIVEATVKTVAGLGLTVLILNLARQSYAQTQKVFWVAVGGPEDAEMIALAFAAAGAMLGVSISTIGGAVYLMFRHRKRGDALTAQELMTAPPSQSTRRILSALVRIAVPVCLGSIATSLTSLIDSFSVMNRLETAIGSDYATIAAQYGAVLPTAKSDIPNFLFGAYGLAQALFNLVPAITTTFGISALPAISSAWALRDREEMGKNVSAALKLTCLVAIPAGIGMSVLAEPIIRLIYFNKVDEALIAVPILRVLGIAVIFVSFMSPINSMLQGIGKADVPVKLMLVGGGLKLIVNFVCVAVPQFNIKAAAWGTLACYVFIAFSSMAVLLKKTKIRLPMREVFFKPLLAGLICGATAFLGDRLLSAFLPSKLATVGAIGLAAVFYLISLLLLRTLSKNDILMLPKGEKIVKRLEKRNLLS